MVWGRLGLKPVKNRRILYFYLLQLLIPTGYVVMEPTTVDVTVGLCLMLLFGLFYTVSFSARGTKRLIAAVGLMGVMWTLSYWLSPGYLSLVYYPGAVLSFLPRRKLVLGYALLIAGSLGEVTVLTHLYHTRVTAYLPAVLGVLVGITSMTFMLRYYSKVQTANDQLARANGEIERLSKLAERARISRDLHDVMGHQLSMITLKAQVAAKLMSRGANPDRAIAEVADIERAAREALARVREYVADIRQPDFDEEWLAAQNLLRAANIECFAYQRSVTDDKSHQVFAGLSMCLREAVTNIVRHSQAKRAFLSLQTAADGRLHLWVADDGVGLSAGAAKYRTLHNIDAWSGSGLKGMRARIDAVGGHLQLWCHGHSVEMSPIEGPQIPWRASVVLHFTAPLQCLSTSREVASP